MTAEQALLLEEVTSAFRERDADGALLPSPAFFDLPEELRREAFEETLRLRRMEAALSPAGTSTTVAAVLSRLR